MTSPALAVTGQWTTTGDLPTASSWYGQHDGALLLKTKKVLVAGGANASSAGLAKAAVYDPVAKTWQATPDPQTARRMHTVTLLDDGKVLVTGGVSGSSRNAPGLTTAEIYNPANNTWAPAAAMSEGRWGHSAVLLPSKKVLVAGGATIRSGDSIKALRTAEIYDPAENKWTKAATMTDARAGHAAVVLKEGRVLVCGGTVPVGGSDGQDAALALCEVYNPAGEGAWTPTGSLLAPRAQHQATALSDSTALVTGGSAPGAPGDGTFDPFSRKTAEVFNLATGAWTAAPDMPSGRSHHRAVSLAAGKVLVIGGTDGVRDGAGYQSAVIFESATNKWTTADGLATGRWAFAATALADGGGVLVTGGAVRSGLAAADPAVTELTPDTEVFTT